MIKKKIAILGSTGSIGKSLIDIILKEKKNFEVVLLTANTNHKKLINQAKLLNVKNLIITNKKNYQILKEKKINAKIYNNFDNFDKIFKSKVDYVMCAITGIDGLNPTFNAIKYTKKIAIANKESIICAWNILNKELKKNNTKFIPVDSEHFSIWSALESDNNSKIDKLYITASGGPFHKLPFYKFSLIEIKDAIKHPNWKMGKKISVDSSTMMNKVFEIIEARNIFNVSIDDLKILIHPDSYLHAIVKFKNGIFKLIVHETDMKIPIFNTIDSNKNYYKKLKDIDIIKLNNLKLETPNLKKFPMVKILKKIPSKISLFDTVLVSVNDTLVELFLKKKIKFKSISKIFYSIISHKDLTKYKLIVPKNINQIINLKNFVQIKINSRYN